MSLHSSWERAESCIQISRKDKLSPQTHSQQMHVSRLLGCRLKTSECAVGKSLSDVAVSVHVLHRFSVKLVIVLFKDDSAVYQQSEFRKLVDNFVKLQESGTVHNHLAFLARQLFFKLASHELNNFLN